MSKDLDKAIAAGILAATMRASASDAEQLLELLAEKFEQSLPEHTRVARKGGLFKKKRVHSIAIAFGEYEYLIERDDRINARRVRIVRGIVIKTEPLTMEEWIDELAAELARQAEGNQRTRDALEQFVIGK
jgi:hypothetical protein